MLLRRRLLFYARVPCALCAYAIIAQERSMTLPNAPKKDGWIQPFKGQKKRCRATYALAATRLGLYG